MDSSGYHHCSCSITKGILVLQLHMYQDGIRTVRCDGCTIIECKNEPGEGNIYKMHFLILSCSSSCFILYKEDGADALLNPQGKEGTANIK